MAIGTASLPSFRLLAFFILKVQFKAGIRWASGDTEHVCKVAKGASVEEHEGCHGASGGPDALFRKSVMALKPGKGAGGAGKVAIANTKVIWHLRSVCAHARAL